MEKEVPEIDEEEVEEHEDEEESGEEGDNEDEEEEISSPPKPDDKKKSKLKSGEKKHRKDRSKPRGEKSSEKRKHRKHSHRHSHREDEAEEEEEISLLDRTDSELTPAQIQERDIMMYELLMAEEHLLEMAEGPQEKEEVVVEVNLEVPETEETDEEEEEEVEEEEEEEEEEEVEAPEEETQENIDEADNIANLLLEEGGEEDELKLLFMDTGGVDQSDSIVNFPGVIGITLSEATQDFFNIKELAEKEPAYTYVGFKRLKLHLYMYSEKSEFYQHFEILKRYPDSAILVGADIGKQTGHDFYFCSTIESRNLVINPPKKKKIYFDIKKKEEEVWAKMASIIPRKWRSLGSELEVDDSLIQNKRPLLTVNAYRYVELFNRPVNFKATIFEPGNKNFHAAFPSKDPATIPLIEIQELDAAVQVMPEKINSSSQTGFSFKRNKMVQYENQFMEQEKVDKIMDLPAEPIINKTRALQRCLAQNEMMNLTVDDYGQIRAVKGHEVEYSNESALLQEYQTYTDLRHSRGRCVTAMTFHPSLEDVVVLSCGEDATFDKRIDFHSKMLMEPNFVLVWDLKDPIHPQMMLDAPSDVFSFSINPSDPNLIAGGCANGQIVLWDLGREYSELKARIQDRRHKTKDSGKEKPPFLEKLKDHAEKFSCPLISPVGLSNLDQSHNKVVTAVAWIPSHVELGKNGTLYENSMGGKSVQFYSFAGDSSMRLWDIRPPKLGMDEYDTLPEQSAIRTNQWVHLESNNWKYSVKYALDDGEGTMYPTMISLSEPRLGDLQTFESLVVKAAGSTGSVSRSQETLKSTSSNIIEDTSSGSVHPVKSKSSQKLQVPSGSHHSVTGTSADGAVSGSTEMETLAAQSARRAAGMLNISSNAQSSIFVGTETGQTALIDWLRSKDGNINADSSRVCQNMYLETIHDGAITCIARSCFYNSLILVVGGGTISVWKESIGHPILATSGSEYFPWCGCWSNTRPAVFFIGTREGALQVWDLTEKSHAPVLIQQISPDRITNCSSPKPKLTKKPFLALSDSNGNLFLMLLSRYYYTPTQSENAFMQELMAREEKRQNEWITEAENRTEKMEAIHKAWKESRIMKTPEEITEEELRVEERLNAEYTEFLEFQAKIVGRIKRDEPSLPTEDLEAEDDELDEVIRLAKEKEDELRERGELVDDGSSVVSLGSEFDFIKF